MIYRLIDGPKDGQELDIVQDGFELGSRIYFAVEAPLPNVSAEPTEIHELQKEVYRMTDIGELTFEGYE